MLNEQLKNHAAPLQMPSRFGQLLLAACKSFKLRQIGQGLSINQRRILRGISQRVALKNVISATIDFAKFEEAANLGAGKLLSIIVPVYNNFPFLEACLISALRQSSSMCEVVVVDDASPDSKVYPLLCKLKESYPNLVLARNETNLGISETQNRLIDMARGRFIAFLDCDDLLDANCVETLLPLLSADIVYLHTGTKILDNSTNSTQLEMSSNLPRRDYFLENRHMFFAKHLKVIRRAALLRVGGFRKKYDAAQDLDIALKIAFYYHTSRFKYCDIPLYTHRIHSLQTTQKSSLRQDTATSQIEKEADIRYIVNQNKKKTLFMNLIELKNDFGNDSITLLEFISEKFIESTRRGFATLAITVEGRSFVDGYQEEAAAVFAGDDGLVCILPRVVCIDSKWFEFPISEGFAATQKTIIAKLVKTDADQKAAIGLVAKLLLGQSLSLAQANETAYVPAIQIQMNNFR
jgi:glycosyltransferase involved in cell wall biosynthesis